MDLAEEAQAAEECGPSNNGTGDTMIASEVELTLIGNIELNMESAEIPDSPNYREEIKRKLFKVKMPKNVSRVMEPEISVLKTCKKKRTSHTNEICQANRFDRDIYDFW